MEKIIYYSLESDTEIHASSDAGFVEIELHELSTDNYFTHQFESTHEVRRFAEILILKADSIDG